MFVANAELIVQMRAGCPTGGPYVADYVALADSHALPQTAGKAVHVSVQRCDAILMTQNYYVAIAVLSTQKIDHSVGSCADSSSGRRAVINAFVLTPATLGRMNAHSET